MFNQIYSTMQGKVSKYEECPKTDILCISETINPSKKNVNEYDIHTYINSLNKYFLFCYCLK